MQRSLETTHLILASVGNGAEGIKAVEEHRPDIVLLDISMPIMNGFDAAEYMQKNCPLVLIIFVTNHTEDAYVDLAFERGAAGYVSKDKVADLPDAIGAVLEGQRYWPTF